MMEEMDADRDGFVDLREFADFHCGPCNQGGGGKDQEQEAASEDHNGLISTSPPSFEDLSTPLLRVCVWNKFTSSMSIAVDKILLTNCILTGTDAIFFHVDITNSRINFILINFRFWMLFYSRSYILIHFRFCILINFRFCMLMNSRYVYFLFIGWCHVEVYYHAEHLLL